MMLALGVWFLQVFFLIIEWSRSLDEGVILCILSGIVAGTCDSDAVRYTQCRTTQLRSSYII